MTDKDSIYDHFDEVFYESDTMSEEGKDKIPIVLPVLPLKDLVVFPHTVYPILAGRDTSVKAINKSITADKYIFLVTQIDPAIENTTSANLYKIGVVAKILQVLRLPNGLIKVLVNGIIPAKVIRFQEHDFITAEVFNIPSFDNVTPELNALVKRASSLFNEYVQANKEIPNEIMSKYNALKEAQKKLYFIASHLNLDVKKRYTILERESIEAKFFEVLYLLNSELEILNAEKEIDAKIYNAMQKNQRKFIVQEQIRILQEELEEDTESDPDLIKLRGKIEKSGMPKPVMDKTMEEFSKLRKTPQMSPEFSVLRNYLDWLVSVPWTESTEDNFDLNSAKVILDEDHYDLEKPKERILELLAVLKLLKDKSIKSSPKGQILCFAGPPGVGKTSLGKSIARAIGRKFVRLSVGGVRDEAEIRGHRRTYIGSMPGKIIQAMKRAGTINPVILIDEIDKMSNDFRGDPSSAMLEVLDPEQNNTFNDHYLEVDYDLSKVLFITTANVKYNIPHALRDRMELIEMSSYMDFQKLEIAKKHIIPNELVEHGLDGQGVKFNDKSIYRIIREYTREAGVRNLEREISSIIRKVAKEKVMNGTVTPKGITITPAKIEEYLGVPKFKNKPAEQRKAGKVGSVFGLAWTPMGGDILTVDANVMKGTGKLTLTGKLGDVMKESAMAGLSYLRSNSESFGIDENLFKENDIHIHLPEGAIPKDGPSAGITMVIAVLSALTKIPCSTNVAMTGEITLRGNVLPIGGLKEKLLAALRSGIMNVIIPQDNEINLKDISVDITSKLNIVTVSKIEQGFELIFGKDKLKKRKVNKKNY